MLNVDLFWSPVGRRTHAVESKPPCTLFANPDQTTIPKKLFRINIAILERIAAARRETCAVRKAGMVFATPMRQRENVAITTERERERERETNK